VQYHHSINSLTAIAINKSLSQAVKALSLWRENISKPVK
jgi:hypothetical protein